MEQHTFDSEESSSGCESGWTLYLQHSIPHHDIKSHLQDDHQHEDQNDDDDMSMVSDASSGPPHVQQDEDEGEDEYNDNNAVFCHSTCSKRQKILKEKSLNSYRHLQDLAATSLDDTASSPFFSFSNKDLTGCNKEALMEDDNSFDYSQGHSTTYFEMV